AGARRRAGSLAPALGSLAGGDRAGHECSRAARSGAVRCPRGGAGGPAFRGRGARAAPRGARLSRSPLRAAAPRLGAGPTVGVTALLFTTAHVQYGAPELIQVFLDGVLFGLARLRTGSTRVPFCMHVLG